MHNFISNTEQSLIFNFTFIPSVCVEIIVVEKNYVKLYLDLKVIINR